MLEIVETTGATSIHVRLTFKLHTAVSITPFKVYLFPISPHSLPFIPLRSNDMRSAESIHGKGYKWSSREEGEDDRYTHRYFTNRDR